MANKFLVAVGEAQDVEPYLAFSADLIRKYEPETHCSRAACIIEVGDADADWQSRRLASGLYGGKAYETFADAEEEARYWAER